MAEFKESLVAGQELEELVLQHIRKDYPCSVRIPGKFPGYDIFIPEKDVKIEVKQDKKSLHTGNLVIETSMFGKPSGIMSTDAHYIYFDTGEELLIICPRDIFKCIVKNNIPEVTFTGEGDTNEKTACLVKVDLLRPYCLKVQKSLIKLSLN
tara:strand:- start:222 stop:677 length:456 start_codon:yes stop_codon:yes gene_type:complete